MNVKLKFFFRLKKIVDISLLQFEKYGLFIIFYEFVGFVGMYLYFFLIKVRDGFLDRLINLRFEYVYRLFSIIREEFEGGNEFFDSFDNLIVS